MENDFGRTSVRNWRPKAEGTVQWHTVLQEDMGEIPNT